MEAFRNHLKTFPICSLHSVSVLHPLRIHRISTQYPCEPVSTLRNCFLCARHFVIPLCALTPPHSTKSMKQLLSPSPFHRGGNWDHRLSKDLEVTNDNQDSHPGAETPELGLAGTLCRLSPGVVILVHILRANGLLKQHLGLFTCLAPLYWMIMYCHWKLLGLFLKLTSLVLKMIRLSLLLVPTSCSCLDSTLFGAKGKQSSVRKMCW